MLVVLHEKRDFLGCVHPFRVILVPVAAHGPLQFERFFFYSYCFGLAAGHGVIFYVPRATRENFYKIGEKSEKCKQTLFL